jgi:serine phosphatase RsbU (regulator of sigma subunit)
MTFSLSENIALGSRLRMWQVKALLRPIIMAVVHASLRIIATEEDISVPQLAARMNSFLHRSTGSNSYATFFYAQLDEASLQLRYVNAGHNPPYLVRTLQSSPSVEELATGHDHRHVPGCDV